MDGIDRPTDRETPGWRSVGLGESERERGWRWEIKRASDAACVRARTFVCFATLEESRSAVAVGWQGGRVKGVCLSARRELGRSTVLGVLDRWMDVT